MYLPPTLINLSACKAAPAHQTPPKLVLLLKRRKLSLLRLSSVLNHDRKCCWNKHSHRNQHLNVKLPRKFLGHTHTHTTQVLCFPYLKLFHVSVCSRGEGYQNISAFLNEMREIKHENTMDVGRKIRRWTPSYAFWFWMWWDNQRHLKQRKMKRPMMVWVNLAQESPVGISIKDPGSVTVVAGSWELLRAGWWLKTPRGRCPRSKHPSSAHCIGSPWLPSLAASPNYLPPGPVDSTFHLLPALQRDTFRKKLDRLFGTFQGTSRSADSCWDWCPPAGQCTQWSALPPQRARALEEKEDQPPRALTGSWM